MPATLKYTDESDKCYGITGMAIGLVIWNAEDIMAAINLDAGPADVFEFVPEYYFCGNPRISAKNSWSHVLKHYQATMGMLIGNILCRSYVLHGTHPSKETRAKLLVCLDEEGRSSCALESDEVERVFNRSYAYLGKVFNHPGVHAVAHDFAKLLKERRQMSRADMMECLGRIEAL